ncbi:MAG: Uma2 family endonuclease, partial [Dehalococcoidia bacterium]
FTLYLREHPIGDAGSEIRCVFGPLNRKRAYVPDFVFVRGVPPGFGAVDGPYRGAPDIAVEILSPDDRISRVRRKVRFYLENGVRIVWLIDPEDRTLSVITNPTEWVIFGEDEWIGGGDVAPGLRVQVRDILPPAVAQASTPQL